MCWMYELQARPGMGKQLRIIVAKELRNDSTDVENNSVEACTILSIIFRNFLLINK